MEIAVEEKAVEELLSKCYRASDSGRSDYRGMTFEQGIAYAIEWMLGNGPHPLDEDDA